MQVKPGGARLGLEMAGRSYLQHLASGLVATDGVQYSAVVSFGTIAAEITNQLIDPGYNLQLTDLELRFKQKFSNVIAAVGSLIYYWQGREEYIDSTGRTPTARTGSWMALSATYSKGIGSLLNSEDVIEGLFPVASLPHAPVRVKLTAVGLVDGSMTGKIRNEAYVRLVGNVIPGC